MTIPKIIHYCWFGPAPLTPLAQRCRASWDLLMPEWQKMFWTEANLPQDWDLVRYFLDRKHYAFASDAARLYALVAHGGIYLDMDVEVLKPLDSLLDNTAFLGWEREGLASNSICGGVAGSPFFAACLAAMKDHVARGGAMILSPELCTKVLQQGDFADLKIYPSEVLFPYNPYDPARPVKQLMASDIRPETLTIHHWAKGWRLSFWQKLARFCARWKDRLFS